MNITRILLTILFVTACGQELETEPKADQDNQEEGRSTTETTSSDAMEAIKLKGYVSSAFSISVDGQSYEDSEDFYNQQLDTLEAEKEANGYGDYELTLEGKLGLDDMKYGMSVYAESVGEYGYGAETVVVGNGTFEMKFPGDANGEAFQVRANKRIGVLLTNDEGDQIKWCFNFFAKSESILDGESKPLLLRNFFTRITKYDCKISKKKDGLSIPHTVEVVPEGESPTDAQIDQWDAEWDAAVEEGREDGGLSDEEAQAAYDETVGE